MWLLNTHLMSLYRDFLFVERQQIGKVSGKPVWKHSWFAQTAAGAGMTRQVSLLWPASHIPRRICPDVSRDVTASSYAHSVTAAQPETCNTQSTSSSAEGETQRCLKCVLVSMYLLLNHVQLSVKKQLHYVKFDHVIPNPHWLTQWLNVNSYRICSN